MIKRIFLIFFLVFLTLFLFVFVVSKVTYPLKDPYAKAHHDVVSLKTKQQKLDYCFDHLHENFLADFGSFEDIQVHIDTILAELLWIGKPAVPRLIELLKDDTPSGYIWGGGKKEDTKAQKALWVLCMHRRHLSNEEDDRSYYELPQEKREAYIPKWQNWWEKNKKRNFDTYKKTSRTQQEPFAMITPLYWLERTASFIDWLSCGKVKGVSLDGFKIKIDFEEEKKSQ